MAALGLGKPPMISHLGAQSCHPQLGTPLLHLPSVPSRPRSRGHAHRSERLPLCHSVNRGTEQVQQQTLQQQPIQPQCSPPSCYSCCWGPALSFGAAVALASYLLHKRERRVAVKEQPDLDLQAPLHPEDPRHHQRVLAKTCQAANIQNAASYQKAGEITKAVLELSKALNNNSVCRTPALTTLSREEIADLYRLHITNTEHPPNFATLLQLQEMLGMSQEEAENVEIEVLQTPGAFAI